MTAQLFLMNVPYNCSDDELQAWIQSAGVEVTSVRLIQDLVSGVSPAFAYAVLRDHTQVEKAIATLNGKRIRNQVITVQRASHGYAAESVQARRAKV